MRPVPFMIALVLLVLLGLLPGKPVGGQTPDPGPTPVLLVPGWLDTAEDLEPLRRRLVDAGWPADRVRAIGFEDPVGSNVSHASSLGEAIEQTLAETGALQVDLVAHSMGGLAVRYYLAELQGARHVRRAVFLGTPHRGTLTAHLGWGQGAAEMEPGSPFLEELNAKPPVPDSVEAAAFFTPIDLRIIPQSSAALAGVTSVRICCPGHRGLLDDPEVFTRLRDFLQEGVSTAASRP